MCVTVSAHADAAKLWGMLIHVHGGQQTLNCLAVLIPAFLHIYPNFLSFGHHRADFFVDSARGIRIVGTACM